MKKEAMKKTAKSEMDDDLRPAYDLRLLLKDGVKGKYAERYRAGTNLVLLDPDLAKAFANDEEKINAALRTTLRPRRLSERRHRKPGGSRARVLWRATVKSSFRQRLHSRFLQQTSHSGYTPLGTPTPRSVKRARRKKHPAVQNRSARI